MQLPSSLPTDSLYKFLAFGGLIAAVAGVLLSGFESQLAYQARRSEAARQLLRQITERQQRIVALEFEVARMEAQNSAERARRGLSPAPSASSRQPLGSPLDTADGGEIALIEPTDAPTDSGVAMNEFAPQAATRYGLALTAAGILTAALGFFWWYVRLQRHLDRLARAQADRAELEADEVRLRVEAARRPRGHVALE